MSDESERVRMWPLERYFADDGHDVLDDDDFERSPLDPDRTRTYRSMNRTASRITDVALSGVASQVMPRIGALSHLPFPRPHLRLKGSRLVGSAALCALFCVLALLLNPSLPSTLLALSIPPAGTTAAPRQVAGPLTAFSDWRMAYQGEDQRLYVVTQDGHTTLAGPRLPELLRRGVDGAAVAAASPDGHWIASLTREAGLALLDLTRTPPVMRVIRAPTSATAIYWSPDSARLAVATGRGVVAIINAADARLVALAGQATPHGVAELGGVAVLGWLDVEHLLIARRELTAGGAAAASIEAVRVATGITQPLAVVRLSGEVLPRFSLSPDGAQLLLVGRDPAAPAARSSAALIDTTSGSIRTLPGIGQTLDGPLAAAAWSPDMASLTVATSVVDPAHPGSASVHEWVLALEDDTAVREHSHGIPLGWTPDGKELIFASALLDPVELGSSTTGATGQLQVQLRAFSLSLRTGKPIILPMAEARQHLPFLGFVRTAVSSGALSVSGQGCDQWMCVRHRHGSR